ncbi:MAG: isochorismatase family cysteine hydrolase [Acidobacteriota bacterium]
MPRTIRFLDESEWPRGSFEFQLPIDRNSTGFCIVDMQNYCVQPQGHLVRTLQGTDPSLFQSYSTRVAGAIARTSDLLSEFREQGRRVFFTRNTVFLPDGMDLVQRRRAREKTALTITAGASGHLPMAESEGCEIVASLAPRPGELVLDKNTASAFHSTGIDLFLRNMGLQTLVMAGIASDMCVLLTALDAADRGFHVIIASDACTTFDPGSHEAALLLFRRVYGYVLTTRQILNWMRGAPAPASNLDCS